MTGICTSGGPSQPKALTDPVIAFTTAVLEPVAIASGLEFLVPYLPIFGALAAVDAAVFCATDPPALPALGQQDFIDLLNFGNIPSQQAALSKFRDFLSYYLWYAECECSSGGTPGPGSPASPPANLPQPTNITVPVQGGGAPCGTDFVAFLHITDNAVHAWNYPPPGTSPQNYALPAQSTSFEWQLLITDTSASGAKLQATLEFFALDGTTLLGTSSLSAWTPTVIGSAVGYATPGGTVASLRSGSTAAVNGLFPDIPYQTANVPAAAAYVHIFGKNNGTASASLEWALQFAVFCGGATPLTDGCCPPDPNVLAGILQIQAQLTALLASQPTLGVRSYAAGAAHAGLSGAGTLAFTDQAIGVKVSLTMVPSSAGQVFGDPVYYANAGFINMVTEQGPLTGVRIEYDGQFIPFPALVASLAYSLAAGFIATITEVTAGP